MDLGYWWKGSMTRRLGEVILYLYSGHLQETPLKDCVELRGAQYKKAGEQVQKRETKMIRALVHLSYVHRLREVGLYIMEKRRLWEDCIEPSGT